MEAEKDVSYEDRCKVLAKLLGAKIKCVKPKIEFAKLEGVDEYIAVYPPAGMQWQTVKRNLDRMGGGRMVIEIWYRSSEGPTEKNWRKVFRQMSKGVKPIWKVRVNMVGLQWTPAP